MEIRAVIFDFGGVLCFSPTDERFERAARACGLPTGEFLRAFWTNRGPYDAGEVGPEEYWSAVANTVGRKFDEDLVAWLRKEEIDFWSHFDDRVIAWADDLRGQGLRTGILSNLPAPLGNYLRTSRSLLKHFDHVSFSYELHSLKPQAAIYSYTVDGLRIPPAQALFLDDREDNVMGARAVGLQAEIFVSWESFVENTPARYGLPVPAAAG